MISRWRLSLVVLAAALAVGATVRPAAAVVSLSVEMTASPDPVGPGSLLTYQIEVTNAGDEAAANVVIEAAEPAGTTFFSASAGGMLQSGNQVVWTVSALAGFGGQHTVDLVVEVDFPSPPQDFIVNAVQVTADNATPVSDGTLTSVQALGLDMTVEATPSGCLGSPFRTYTVRFSNGATNPVSGLELTAVVPPGTTFDAADLGGSPQCSASASLCASDADCPASESCDVVWSIGTLSSGAQGFRTLGVRIDDIEPGGSTFDTSALLTNGGDAATDTAPTTTVENLPCPTLAKTDIGGLTVEPGGRIQYRLTAANLGRAAATNSVVSDPLPAGTTFATADPSACAGSGPAGTLGLDDVVRWTLGTLDPGEVTTVCLEVDVIEENPVPAVINTASFTDDEGDVLDAVESTAVQAVTALKLTKDAEPSPVEPGEQVVFEMTFQNLADFTVNGVVITDDLNADLTPAGCTSFNAAQTAACGSEVPVSEAAGVLTWAVGSVVPGGVVTVCFVVNVDGCEDEMLRNVARVADDRGEQTTATGRTQIRGPGGGGEPVALRLLKKAPGQPKVQAGDVITYTLEVANRTAAPLTGVTITDDLGGVAPAGALAFESAASSTCNGTGPNGSLVGSTVTWSFPTLTPGDHSVCLQARTNVALTNDTLVRNTALITDLAGHGAEDSITTTVFVRALRVRILDLDDPVQPGGEVRYEVSVDNLGDVPLDGVTVSTRLPPGTVIDCVSGGANFDCGGLPGDVTLARDPSVAGRRALWTLDQALGTTLGNNSRTMNMTVTVTGNRRGVRAKAKARESTLRSKSKSRALTVVEE